MSDYGDGIACPFCGEAESVVKDSRALRSNMAIRRRRLCPAGHRFTTIEAVIPVQGLVIRQGFGNQALTCLPLNLFMREVGERLNREVARIMQQSLGRPDDDTDSRTDPDRRP